MFNNFTEEARKILIGAKSEMINLNHPYIGSEHLLLAILKSNNDVSKKLNEYELNYDNFKSQLIKLVGIGSKKSNCFLYTPLLKRILETAMIDSRENNKGSVTINHMFSSLLEEGEGVAIRIMLGMGIDLDEIYNEFTTKLIKHKKNNKLLIDEIGIDLTKKALNGELDPVIGRDDEIRRVLEILSRRKKNNPLLIGDAGVGKTAIVEELSRLISIGEVPRILKNKRIISVDMASTVAGTKYRGEFEERIHKMLKELEDNDDIILFIDEIHTIVGAGGAEGAIDASNIFKPALARNKMRLIGATTIEEYKKYINDDRALERRFQKVYIEEPSNEKLKEILLKIKKTYEDYHHVYIADNYLDLIIDLSNKYIVDRRQPDKAIDILDEVCAHVSLKENKQIKKYNELNKELKGIIAQKNSSIINNDFKSATKYKILENDLMDKINNLELNLYNKNYNHHIKKEDIIKVVSLKANMPIYENLNNYSKDIIKLKGLLSKTVIGQENAVAELIKIYKQIKLGFKDDSCYSLLFAGPSGVGKTLLSKIFGEFISKNVIKLDMSEYSEPHSISKLIGSPAGYVGYNDSKNILEKIKDNPFTLLILDEFDKAHSNIINLFFQALDEGVIRDSKGDIVSLKNAVIIMTTNVGYERNSIGFNKKNNSQLKDTFSIPFINRVDKVVFFNSLTLENVKLIIKNKISKLKRKYKDIKIIISKSVIDEIIEKISFNEFGARKIDKVIKQDIEDLIISDLMENKKIINIKTLKEKQLT